MLKPIKRVNMRNALIGALAREGVQVTPDKMDSALLWLSEGDTRPDNLPEHIVFGGVRLAWPRGRETRVPQAGERLAYNKALKHLHTSEDSGEALTDEDNVRVYRTVYEALVARLNTEPNMALPALTQREIEQAQAIIDTPAPVVIEVAAPRKRGTRTPKAAPAPVIEHVVPDAAHINALDQILADLSALNL